FSCANLFWWYNMYSTADYSVTPRPNYLADGRKIPDIYSHPPQLRDHLQNELGTFPLFHFWGPKTSIKSSQWIADAAIKTDILHQPTLSLVYLPHLDYNLQRHGLNFKKIGKDLHEIDGVVKKLVEHYQKQGTQVILLSEYGITDVSRPIHLNRILRAGGYLAIRMERGLELLDAGASSAFAVADHQIAHIYLNDPSLKEEIRKMCKKVEGVAEVLSDRDLESWHLNHERCGDLVVIADANSWFTYYFWEDDKKAPDFARMVDIHKKPGYDPVEMFTDPSDHWVIPKVIAKLFWKKLGFRTILNIIPLKAELVKGSHGRIPGDPDDYPIFITSRKNSLPGRTLKPTEIFDLLESHIVDV
ncbi:MAG TPA: alkaline phosphatase family protein, partial [Eudoraea sp.]|nr:alkaline phosphatase family protein [Eudoraea sp.]